MIFFENELNYRTSRSSGPGGQNVNKVESAVTVLWKPEGSAYFTDEQISRIKEKLKNRMNNDGVLQLTGSESRTQLQKKKLAKEKIQQIVNESLFVDKPRKKTKPSKGQVQKRQDAKKRISDKKENRKFR